jgi:hypothetical protein
MFELFSVTDKRADLAKALVQAQASMGPAIKDSKNPHYRSSYASLSAVIGAVIPALNEQGVAVMQLPQLTTILMHTSGQMLSSTVATPMGKKQDAQAVGSAITYLRRYALQSIMGLPVEDDDGNAASRRTVQPVQRRSLPSTQDWAALIAAELEGAGLTVDAFKVWADKAGKPGLDAMKPQQKKLCYEWLAHGNGLQTIKSST